MTRFFRWCLALTMLAGCPDTADDFGGDDFPAFDGPDSLVLSSALQLVSPAVPDYFEFDGELPLEWNGGSLPDVTIELFDDDLEDDDNVYVHCIADNDGAFTIPAAVVDELPWDDIWVQLNQPINTAVLPAGDRWVGVASGVWSVAVGYKP